MLPIELRKLAATAIVILSWAQPAYSKQSSEEDSQLVTRTIVVQRAALQGDAKALARLNHELSAAVRNVCEEIYPSALVYLTHLCVSETLHDARDQLNRIRSDRSASNVTPGGRTTVAVRAR